VITNKKKENTKKKGEGILNSERALLGKNAMEIGMVMLCSSLQSQAQQGFKCYITVLVRKILFSE